jgi:metal-responsive CopG/Arc/MetJ family transcriptional regulator
MKTAISIPDAIFKAAEKLARRLGFSRSELYTKAVIEYLQKHRDEGVTRRLNEIYSQQPSRLDPVVQALQSDSLNGEDWE